MTAITNVAELMVYLSSQPAGARVELRFGTTQRGSLSVARMDDLMVVLEADATDLIDPETGRVTHCIR